MKTTTQNTKLSKADKIVLSESSITKNEVINYYDAIAEQILFYLKKPSFNDAKIPKRDNLRWFFQKNTSQYFPDWIKTVNVKKDGGCANYIGHNHPKEFTTAIRQEQRKE